MPKKFISVAGVVACLLNGCASVETTGLSTGWKEGISYNLPKGMFRVNVVDNAGVLTVTLGGPVMVADPFFPLVSRLPRSGTSDNDAKVTVDPKTNLLSKVDVTSTGDVGTLIQNLASAVSLLQGGTETGGITVFSKSYDVGQLSTVASDDVNKFLAEYFIGKCGALTKAELPYDKLLKTADTAADTQALATACRKMKLAGVADAVTLKLVTIKVVSPDIPTPPNENTSSGWQPEGIELPTNVPLGSACAKGVCYRPMTTLSITLRVTGAFEQSDIFLLPDSTKTMLVQLPQGVFAQQKYTLTFTDGVLTEYDQNTKSELVGLSTLPVSVVTAVLKAPADALGLKTASLKAKADYLAQLSALQTARDNAATACKNDANSCPLTAMKIIGARITDKSTPTPAAPPLPSPTPTPDWLSNDTAPQ